jgi:uncharacterized membrane protein
MHPSTTVPHATPAVPRVATPPAERARMLVTAIERVIVWIGSPASLVLHTLVFMAFFAVPLLGMLSWETMFAVLTNVVSLEAIYLAIFIQMSVNRQAASLKEVEENVEELGENVESIQEDVEELGENVEELGENMEELGEDVEELGEDVEELGENVEDIKEEIAEDPGEEHAEEMREQKHAEMLEALTKDVQAMLKHLETLKSG